MTQDSAEIFRKIDKGFHIEKGFQKKRVLKKFLKVLF